MSYGHGRLRMHACVCPACLLCNQKWMIGEWHATHQPKVQRTKSSSPHKKSQNGDGSASQEFCVHKDETCGITKDLVMCSVLAREWIRN